MLMLDVSTLTQQVSIAHASTNVNRTVSFLTPTLKTVNILTKLLLGYVQQPQPPLKLL